ncbi:MAG: glycoside hydrolase family 31 protein [Bacteroidales bacterium]|nr:glycoside hydrolase family 31 protein [Bacteroidales bacterium]
MKLIHFWGITLFLFVFQSAIAQVIWLKPGNPSVTDSVTLYFNAAEGNKALLDQAGDVYLHTGVITSKSIDGHDWKYVVGNWGKDDKSVLMKREGKNLYSYRFVISSFYKLKPEDIANQLVYVFRNADGSLVGKTKENEDILVPVNGYKPKVQEATGGNKELHKLIRVEKLSDSWNIITDNGTITVKPYSESLVEVTYFPEGISKADLSHSVVMQPGKSTITSEQIPSGYLLRNDEMTITANADPFYLTYIYKGDTLLSEESGFFSKPGNSGVRFALKPGEKVYGAGERTMAMDRRGKKLVLYNRPAYGYEYGAAQLNYSVPLTISSRKYAILFDNPQKGYVDIGNTEPTVTEWSAIGGTARYYLIAGSTYSEISKSYTQLTGRQPLPPRWALGNLQSRMAYRNQKETDSIVTLMQEKGFPVDAVILDFYWFGDSIQGHLGKLDWYKKAWPDPAGMIAKFKKQGIKTILITEPYVIDTVANHKDAAAKGVFVTDSLGQTYIDKQFYFGAGSLIDIFKPEARDWFWEKYKKQIDIGIAAWWGDLGEPESHPADIWHVNGKADQVHNIYGHYWDKMLFEKYAENYPNTRLFHLQRSGFAGSQRYAAYPWTGDVSRSWGGLQAQLPLLLTMGMSGLGYIHSDAGGFAQGVKDDELYTRWLQFAVFTPILRPHGSVIPSEPVYWSEKTQDIVRIYMKLRYAMLPYNYTLAYQNATTGSPLMRPLFYQFANDTAASRIEDEYMWGENLLVAPVIKKGLTSRSIYLPEGKWFDFTTGTEYAGSNRVDFPLTIENLPVFAKAGSFIPMAKSVTSTDYYDGGNYVVRYYPSGQSAFTQYEDNGLDSKSLSDGKYELITYKGSKESNKTTVSISKTGSWEGMPASRSMKLEIRTGSNVAKVLVNGKAIKIKAKKGKSPGKKTTATYEDKWLYVYFNWDGKPITIDILDNVRP